MIGTTHRRLAVASVISIQSTAGLPSDLSVSSNLPAAALDMIVLVVTSMAALIGTTVPDLDLRYLRRYPWLGHVVPHRGPTHSIVGLAVVGFPLLAACSSIGLPWSGIALLWGWLFHIFADALTQQGVAFLWPWNRRLHLLPRPLCVRRRHEVLLRRLSILMTIALPLIPILHSLIQ